MIEQADLSKIEIAPQANIPLAGAVNLVQLANGQILCKAACPGGRVQFNTIMTTAMQDMVRKYMEQEAAQASGIIQAPPGLVV